MKDSMLLALLSLWHLLAKDALVILGSGFVKLVNLGVGVFHVDIECFLAIKLL